MSLNLNRHLFFRLWVLLICSLVISNIAIAQKRLPQNIRRITVTNQYVFENGNKTNKFWAVYQEMFDSTGRLHTEIDLNFPDHYPHNFIWHSYKGQQRIKTEIFENEKLRLVKEFFYNRDSLIAQEIVKSVKPGDTSLYLTLKYKYNKSKKPVQIDAKLATGKTAYSSKSTYDLNGTEITRNVKVSKGYYPEDSILKMSCKPKYDSIGRLIQNRITITKSDKKHSAKLLSYSYDKKNNITGITFQDSKGNLISREERVFQENRNRLQQIKYYDSNNNLIKWLAKRYEIYRTNDLRFMEIEY
jgi:hypothetical protein